MEELVGLNMAVIINFSDYRASEEKVKTDIQNKPSFSFINNAEIQPKRMYTEEEYTKAIQIQRKLAYNIVLLLKLNETMPVEEAIQAIIQKAGE